MAYGNRGRYGRGSPRRKTGTRSRGYASTRSRSGGARRTARGNGRRMSGGGQTLKIVIEQAGQQANTTAGGPFNQQIIAGHSGRAKF